MPAVSWGVRDRAATLPAKAIPEMSPSARNGIAALRADDQVALEAAVDRRRRALGVRPGGQGDADAVDDRVALDPRARHLMIAVDRRVGHAVHHRDRAREILAREALEVVVAHDLVAVDDAHAAGVGDMLAEEDVALDEVAVAVAQHEGALRFEHEIAAQDVAARLDRDDLDLAAAAVEDVALDDRAAVRQRFLAGADPDRLAAVRAQRRARARNSCGRCGAGSRAAARRGGSPPASRRRWSCPRNANGRRGCRCRRARPRCPRRGDRAC